jgi:hypothetical protein
LNITIEAAYSTTIKSTPYSVGFAPTALVAVCCNSQRHNNIYLW